MRIGLKITACLLGLALLVAAVGYRAWRTNDTVRDHLDVLAGSAVQEVLGPGDMLLALEAVQQACSQLIAARAQTVRAANASVSRTIDALVDAIESGMDAVDSQIAASRRGDGTGVASSGFDGSTAVASGGSLDRIASETTLHRSLLRQVVRLSASQPAAAARLFQERVQPHYLDVLVPMIQTYQDEAESRLRQDAAAAQDRLRRANVGNAVLVALALAIAAVLGALLMRSLVRRDEALRQAAARIADGDLGARMEDGARQELGDLAGPLDEMARRLQATTVSRRSLETVVGAIDEIAVVTDPEGRVAMVNRAAVDRLGWDPAEVCGRPVDQLLRMTTRPDGVELIAHDGTIRRATCSPRTLHDPAGRPQGRVWIARDAG
jgi:PAS domain-containing protein